MCDVCHSKPDNLELSTWNVLRRLHGLQDWRDYDPDRDGHPRSHGLSDEEYNRRVDLWHEYADKQRESLLKGLDDVTQFYAENIFKNDPLLNYFKRERKEANKITQANHTAKANNILKRARK